MYKRRMVRFALALSTLGGAAAAWGQAGGPVQNLAVRQIGQALELTWQADAAAASLGVFNVERREEVIVRHLLGAGTPPVANPVAPPIQLGRFTPAPPGLGPSTAPPFRRIVQTGAGVAAGPRSFSYRDLDVAPGWRYCYRIEPQRTNGTRLAHSNEACLEIPAPCSAPQQLPVTLVSPPPGSSHLNDRPISVQWAPPPGTSFATVVFGCAQGRGWRTQIVGHGSRIAGTSVTWSPVGGLQCTGTLTITAYDAAQCTLGSGNWPLTLTGPLQIGGTVFRQTAGGSTLEGVQVQLLNQAGALLQTRATLPTGQYTFTGLSPGTYVLRVLPQTIPGFTAPLSFTPQSATRTLVASSIANVDFVGS